MVGLQWTLSPPFKLPSKGDLVIVKGPSITQDEEDPLHYYGTIGKVVFSSTKPIKDGHYVCVVIHEDRYGRAYLTNDLEICFTT